MYNVGIAYFLWLISGFGALGFHRFYLGKPISGIIWMCTGGLGMVGSVWDFLTMSGQVRDANLRVELRAALQGKGNSYVQPMRYVDPSTASWKTKESLERTILRVAKKNAGLATASDVALEGDVRLEDATAALDKLASTGYAELRVRKSGTLVYVFKEFMPDTSDFEDF